MEKWKPVVGYEGLYEVSNLGNVRGLDRLLPDGRHWKGKQLKHAKFGNGYFFVCLMKNKTHRNELIHRLVAMAFLPNPLNAKVVNHIDGNKTNNKVSNLEWVTHSENQKHSARIGLRKTKLNIKTLEYIQDQILKGRSQQDIANELKVSQVLISQALSGKLSYLKESI